MDELSKIINDYKPFLERYSFNVKEFEILSRKVKAGELSLSSNKVMSAISHPQETFCDYFTSFSPEEKDFFIKMGENSLKKQEVAALILNGGMATRFGSVVKGLEVVLEGKSFLDIKISAQRMLGEKLKISLPFIIMNGFLSEEPTKNYLKTKGNYGFPESDILCFNQSVSIRLTKNGDIFKDEKGEPSFYTPGHGDFFKSFKKAGLHKILKDRGVKYLFFSNLDNLAATVDPLILGYHISKGKKITNELTINDRGDVAGSPLIVEDKLQLVEGFRIPENYDVSKIRFINTNNFVFTLDIFEAEPYLAPYYVLKKIHERDAVQLETITCELTKFFETNYLVIEREGIYGRFLPIKKKEDIEFYQKELKTFHIVK